MAVTYKRVLLAGAELIDGGGSGSETPPYVQTFITGSWTGPTSGQYTITVPESTHGKGTSPMVQVYETSGAISDQVTAFIRLNASGDVSIIVTETPDLRFEGKIIID